MELLHHLQPHYSIGMVHVWIYIMLGRQMSEPTILFFKYFYGWKENQEATIEI